MKALSCFVCSFISSIFANEIDPRHSQNGGGFNHGDSVDSYWEIFQCNQMNNVPPDDTWIFDKFLNFEFPGAQPFLGSEHVGLHKTKYAINTDSTCKKIAKNIICEGITSTSIWFDDTVQDISRNSIEVFKVVSNEIILKDVDIVTLTNSPVYGCPLPTEPTFGTGLDYDLIGNPDLRPGEVFLQSPTTLETFHLENMLFTGSINDLLRTDGTGFKAWKLKKLVIRDTLMTGDLSLVQMTPDPAFATFPSNWNPEEIGWTGLRELEYLDLSNRHDGAKCLSVPVPDVECGHFYGKIPLDWMILSKLKYLDLSGNDLDGFEAGYDFNYHPLLEYLDVSNNPDFNIDFSGNFVMPNLEVLLVSGTKISLEGVDLKTAFPKLKRVSIIQSSGEIQIPLTSEQITVVGTKDIRPTNDMWRCTSIASSPKRCSAIPGKIDCVSEDGVNCLQPAALSEFENPDGEPRTCRWAIQGVPFHRYNVDNDGEFLSFADCSDSTKCKAFEGHCTNNDQCEGNLVCAGLLDSANIEPYFYLNSKYFDAATSQRKLFCIPPWLDDPTDTNWFITKDPEYETSISGVDYDESDALNCDWDTQAMIWCPQNPGVAEFTDGSQSQDQDLCVPQGAREDGNPFTGLTYIQIKNTMMGGNFKTSLRLIPDDDGDENTPLVSPITELDLQNNEFSGTLQQFTTQEFPHLTKLTLKNNRITGDIEDIRSLCIMGQQLPSYQGGLKTKIKLERPYRLISQSANTGFFHREPSNTQTMGWDDIIFETKTQGMLHINNAAITVTHLNTYPPATDCHSSNNVIAGPYEHCSSELKPATKQQPYIIEFEVDIPYDELLMVTILSSNAYRLYNTKVFVNDFHRFTIREADHHFEGEFAQPFQTDDTVLQSPIINLRFVECHIDEPLVYDSYERPEDYALRTMEKYKNRFFTKGSPTEMSEQTSGMHFNQDFHRQSYKSKRVTNAVKSMSYRLRHANHKGTGGFYNLNLAECDDLCGKSQGCAGFLHHTSDTKPLCLLMRAGFIDWTETQSQGSVLNGIDSVEIQSSIFGNDDKNGVQTECAGDCDGDSDCADGLKCWQRGEATNDNNPHIQVPGCSGQMSFSQSWWDEDYCYDPANELYGSYGFYEYDVYVAMEFIQTFFRPDIYPTENLLGEPQTFECSDASSNKEDGDWCSDAFHKCKDRCALYGGTDLKDGCFGFQIEYSEQNNGRSATCSLYIRDAFYAIINSYADQLELETRNNVRTFMLSPYGGKTASKGLVEAANSLHSFWKTVDISKLRDNPTTSDPDELQFTNDMEKNVAWLAMKCKESCDQSLTCSAWEFCYPKSESCPDLCYTFDYEHPPQPLLTNTNQHTTWAGTVQDSEYFQVAFPCSSCAEMGYLPDECECGVCGSSSDNCDVSCHPAAPNLHKCYVTSDQQSPELIACSNNIKDNSETDVDCGGDVCGPCGTDKQCSVSSDCSFGNICQQNPEIGSGTYCLTDTSTTSGGASVNLNPQPGDPNFNGFDTSQGGTAEQCIDICTSVPGWYDSGGPLWNCEMYELHDKCESYGDKYANMDFDAGQRTANEACCGCGGGIITSSCSQTF